MQKASVICALTAAAALGIDCVSAESAYSRGSGRRSGGSTAFVPSLTKFVVGGHAAVIGALGPTRSPSGKGTKPLCMQIGDFKKPDGDMPGGGAKSTQHGAASEYLKKIPGHLQGLAIRKAGANLPEKRTGMDKKEYFGDGSPSQQEIQDELDEDDELDLADLAMNMLDEEIDVSNFQGDVDDAAILKSMKLAMHPDDFREIFGKRVGELL